RPREGEIEGRDYYFIDAAEFERRAKNNAFLEHAAVFENRYGTPRQAVDDILASGKDVLFDIDWQGTQQLKQQKREDVVTVFVLPPSHGELERRLHTRAQDSDEVVQSRMAKAAGEISHWPEYDYIIVNAVVDTALMQLETILAAERLKRTRQIGLPDFVRDLTAKN
ncbi:MAG TPA: guanylate kinase, partial [Rhizomicrobium sp.]|nr:guanylate kinase [Rhizomicrobium sp.]